MILLGSLAVGGCFSHPLSVLQIGYEVILFLNLETGLSVFDDDRPYQLLATLHGSSHPCLPRRSNTRRVSHTQPNVSLFTVLVWLIVGIFGLQQWLQHRRSRLVGYLNFYRKTQLLRKIPLFIYSIGRPKNLCEFIWAEKPTALIMPDMIIDVL